jgi:hypothetical protein
VPVPVPVVAHTSVVPSIIITGTKVVTSLSALTNPPPAPELAPSAPVSVPANPPAAPSVNAPAPVVASATVSPANLTAPANIPAIGPAPVPVTPTNAQAPAPTHMPVAAAETPSNAGKKLIVIGAILFITAGVLTTLVLFYFLRRPDRHSLISRSMHDK